MLEQHVVIEGELDVLLETRVARLGVREGEVELLEDLLPVASQRQSLLNLLEQEGAVRAPCIFQDLLVGLAEAGELEQRLLVEVLVHELALLAMRLVGRGRVLLPLHEVLLDVDRTAAPDLVGEVRLQLEEKLNRPAERVSIELEGQGRDVAREGLAVRAQVRRRDVRGVAVRAKVRRVDRLWWHVRGGNAARR